MKLLTLALSALSVAAASAVSAQGQPPIVQRLSASAASAPATPASIPQAVYADSELEPPPPYCTDGNAAGLISRDLDMVAAPVLHDMTFEQADAASERRFPDTRNPTCIETSTWLMRRRGSQGGRLLRSLPLVALDIAERPSGSNRLDMTRGVAIAIRDEHAYGGFRMATLLPGTIIKAGTTILRVSTRTSRD